MRAGRGCAGGPALREEGHAQSVPAESGSARARPARAGSARKPWTTIFR